MSIIVPTYNRVVWLSAALESLIDLETDNRFEYEVVVVDNGSTDATASVVSEFVAECRVPIRYVFEEREGVAQARNAGIRNARGDWLAFFDDDQVASTDWLKNLISAADITESKCLGGTVKLNLSEEALQRIDTAYRKTALRESIERDRDAEIRPYRRNEYPGTGNLLISRSLADDVGGFDETMACGGEDFDLAIRIKRAGYAMSFVKNAVIKHQVLPYRLTPEYMRWDAVQGGAMMAYLDYKYKSPTIAVLLGLARIGKFMAWTFPCFLFAKFKGNSSAEFAYQMRAHRLEGYVKGLIAAFFPHVKTFRDSLFHRLTFRRGREIESRD